MLTITTKKEITQFVKECHLRHQSIGLVPTMGALHNGHGSLIGQAIAQNDVTIVSVFVNPTQFNNKEDLVKYPRNIEKDANFLERLGVSVMFAPSPEEMYSEEEMNHCFVFDFNHLDEVMEGKMRPGHFNGVVQVVSRLFYLTEPTRAYFGEKDFQQLAILQYMVNESALKDTFHDLQIVPCPIVREESGLALSSRNERLSETEKQLALGISRTLFQSLEWAKTQSVKEVEQRVVDTINSIEGLEVEYYQIVDQSTLQPVSTFQHAIGCITVYCGSVRLIDNIKY